MKDFSLFHGRSRFWLPIVATLAAAVGIATLARGPSDVTESCVGACPAAESQAELELRRSSAEFETGPDGSVGGELPASVWSEAPQSAEDVPFVSLQPSPEPMTDAGRRIAQEEQAPGG